MPLLHIIILALVQGITEFLPVSSSGHLVITHSLLGQNVPNLCWEQNRVMDVAVHLGTLFSVLVYFRKDVIEMLCGFTRVGSAGFKKTWFMVGASIPVIIAGLLLSIWEPSLLCLLEITAWTTLIFGIVLWVADTYKPATRTLDDMGWKDAMLIGLAQVLALIPGTSRSGITMTAARALGYTRTEAAHFSMLLAIVAISGAGVLGGLDIIQSENVELGLDALIAAVIAFFAGWAAIALMMEWLKRSTFTPFAIYRVILGGGLLIFIYSGMLG
ncbi:MAG: undecaprenyl-diphosphate phosphatase [Pseudomonadota bacterium]